MTTLKQIIEDTKERVKSDWNYKKGVSLVKQGVEMIYNDMKQDGFYTEDEILETIESEMTVYVAKTGTIYLELDIIKVRIGDHSQELTERWKSQALTGSVTGKLKVEMI